MKTVGATPARIRYGVLAEALAIAVLSWLAAVVLALPLTAYLAWLIGTLGFFAPLAFVITPTGALLWLALALIVSVVATLPPSRRAARLSVAAALAHS